MILHQLRLPRTADAVDLTDLTAATRTDPARWIDCEQHDTHDCLSVPFDTEPTADEQTAIRRRLVCADAADEARLYDLLAMRAAATSDFERMWLDTELGKYGERP